MACIKGNRLLKLYIAICVLKHRLACILIAVSMYYKQGEIYIVLKQHIFDTAISCIALNQEMLLLLHPFAIRNFSTVL